VISNFEFGTPYTVTASNDDCTSDATEEFTVLAQIGRPSEPTTACYETATFNTNTCQWDITGTQPAQPTIACYETATFNTTTCQWVVTGALPAQPSCTPPARSKTSVVVNGNTTWAQMLPNISSDNITGFIHITGSGTMTVANKSVLLKSKEAVLVIEGIQFIVNNGNFILDNTGAQVIINNAAVRISGNLQQKPLTSLCVSNSELEVGDEAANGRFNTQGVTSTAGSFQNDGGFRYLKDVLLNVTQDLQLSSTGNGTASGGGLDMFVNVKGEIGDRGATHACSGTVDGNDSGNWQNSKRQDIYCSEFTVIGNVQNQSSSTMSVDKVGFRTLKGSFQNSGTLSGKRLNLAIKDQIQNSGSWTALVEMWFAAGTSGTMSLGTKAQTMKAVLDAKFSACPVASNKSAAPIGLPVTTSELQITTDPNPFIDRVRFNFESPLSGQGSIEVFNMLGQKVGTAFQGFVEAGKKQTVTYQVPGNTSSSLIYIFRIGEKRLTGKLINIR
jgi:hypothetical protein